jgi:hypothetical protein
MRVIGCPQELAHPAHDDERRADAIEQDRASSILSAFFKKPI